MAKFKITCPDCGTVVLTTSPLGVIWELCPGCRHHIWDIYDLMMAEREPARHGGSGNVHTAMNLHSN